MTVEVSDLRKCYGDVVAINGVSIDIPQGKITVVLGPSGCGKTTLLRCIAGLETPDEGRITIEGLVAVDRAIGRELTPDRRPLSMVFQSYALWPHMTVFDNVAFSLRRSGRPRQEVAQRVADVLGLVQLDEMNDRFPHELSGGQQQRVALARSVVAERPLVLLDEPLSNLDAKLREEMRIELRRLQETVGSTFVHVTHDQIEALELGDFIIVMRDGSIVQSGTPEEIYFKPRNRFVAGFIGSANFLHGRVQSYEDIAHSNERKYVIRTGNGVHLVGRSAHKFGAGSDVVLCVRPEQITISTSSSSDIESSKSNLFTGDIVDRRFRGEDSQYDVVTPAGMLTLSTRDRPGYDLESSSAGLSVGSSVDVEFEDHHGVVLEAEDTGGTNKQSQGFKTEALSESIQ